MAAVVGLGEKSRWVVSFRATHDPGEIHRSVSNTSFAITDVAVAFSLTNVIVFPSLKPVKEL